MSTKKIISINPELFNVGSKTRKIREKKPPVIPQLISPNILKNKLLERIKNHKLKETEGLVNNKTKLDEPNNNKKPIYEPEVFSDEFSDSNSYFQALSNQKKIDKKKELMNNKTLKRYVPYNNNISMPNVNLELPEELKENIIPTINSIYSLKPNEVPYGILKNGSKPTYREYNKTQRAFEVNSPKQALIIENKQTIMGGISNEREKRMNNLKEKLLQKKMEKENKQIHTQLIHENNNNNNNNNNTTPVINIQTEVTPNINTNLVTNQNINQNPVINQNQNPIINQNQNIVSFSNDVNQEPFISQEPTAVVYKPVKKLLKRTIKRNYTLGKSKIKRTVGVLLKDRATRKKVLDAHREIKKHNINDIKQYLREHNLIKVGSNATNDVLKKMYETSMLAGEITNINKEAMLHNFMKDDIEDK
jgi:hypothetical protein